MRKHFVFSREDRPDMAWLARFAAGRDEAERWYLGERRAAPASAAECRVALRAHMPELVPHLLIGSVPWSGTTIGRIRC